jgi:membrane-associated tyrosine- and threonine-specific cdc2-inhibitory kinase
MQQSYKGIHNLPVPEIEEVNLSHSFKQVISFRGYNHRNSAELLKFSSLSLHTVNNQPRNQNARPPRLNPKHDISINRSLNSTGAQTISFRRESDSVHGTPLFSPIYNKLKEETYFEQCFEQITKIGEGSFGEVFKALSKDDGQFYAIKKSKRFLRANGYRTERLEEVKRIEQFSEHEHCVTLYKAWEQNDCLYMQMELCKGSLEYYAMATKSIPEVMVWSCLLDLLLALKSLHDRNLIHLDIKLDNILITEEKSCKLADFGLVFDLSRKDHTRAMEGDSRYIAPELLQGKFSKSVDVFSLGIAILELSCNLELPSNGPLWQELRNDVLPDEVAKLVSTELLSIIRSMMASDPARRPSVDTLLQYPRFQKMMVVRRRVAVVKRFVRFHGV